MITSKHLAIIRAALTFWDEEMGAAGESVYSHYLHSNDNGTKFTADDVAQIRVFFNSVDLLYALVGNDTAAFVSSKAVGSLAELPDQTGETNLANVLVARTR